MPNSSDPIDTSPNQKGDDFANHARAYLGRGETRLSTMHRVAGVFVGGAGLLTLIPFFLKDVVTDIIRIIQYGPWTSPYLTNNITYLAITWFLISTFAISCVALYFLFKELVLFYFTPHEETSKIFLPRFSVSSISIPFLKDQNREDIQKQILLTQEEKFFAFLLPKDKKSTLYKNYHEIYKLVPKIIGTERLSIYEQLKIEGKFKNQDTDHTEYIEACLTAMGMSGLQNRTLLEEIARLEVSLCRHANSLRRLVLRYFKSFLLIGFRIILIFLVGIIIHGVLSDDPIEKKKLLQENQHSLLVFALIFFVLTSGFTPLVLRAPIKWIAQLSSELIDSVTSQWDHDISSFEQRVFCFVVFELLAELVGGMALWNPPERIGFFAASALLLAILIGYIIWIISHLNLFPNLFPKKLNP